MTFRNVRRQAPALLLLLSAIAAASIGVPTPAMAHPHIFVDAEFEAVGGADGYLSALRHTWRFDEVFSSSVLLDFDKNENMTLEPPELEAVAKTVSASLSKYSYYTNITVDGKTVALGKPDAIKATYVDQALTLSFSLKPSQPTPLKGLLVFRVYDPTLYTALDFANDADLQTTGEGFARCKRKVVRPGSKEILAQNQAMLTSLFFSDPTGTDYSQLVATRLEVRC
ncbi:DUF1007 family protein [Rhizobium leguminosarum]|uniref:DUF1007 family protein n=1 Tax=Rhizobium leguminosarum TaxID=384 RepID=UPI001C984D1F|nr:DUF1007 family protein [Rhizobium leguminosarum]MBY5639357.1 DUF1007 family protein [Rhizobium leguminosarum]